MALDLDEMYAAKHSIVDAFFIKTADNNYINARWCAFHGLDLEFFWQALHCLEKYMKAALVLNGRSALGHSHDIVRLFAEVQPLAPELIPATLSKPAQYALNYWGAETPGRFIERLYQDGQAANRYALFGYVRHMEDVLKLDQTVFAIRCFCQPLESHFLTKKRDDVPDESIRDWLVRGAPSFRDLHSTLEETIAGKKGDETRQVLLNWNFPFAPRGFVHGDFSYTSSAENPVLVRRIFEPLECGPQYFAEADRLWNWLKSNIIIPRTIIAEIEAERDRIKAKFAP
jgi:hypothetical protein